MSQINVLRFGGLITASVNGGFAVMILWIYKDDPAGGRPCSQRGAESSESDAQFIATCLLLGMYTSSNSFNLPFLGPLI